MVILKSECYKAIAECVHDGVNYIIAEVTEKINIKIFCLDNGVLKEEKPVIM